VAISQTVLPFECQVILPLEFLGNPSGPVLLLKAPPDQLDELNPAPILAAGRQPGTIDLHFPIL
jgi:hypothetical protein